MLSETSLPSHDTFSGHLGHLSTQQEEAFAVFKEGLRRANLYQPPTDTLKASHDDTTLLRFLRARSWQPSAAQKQFHDAEDWRRKHGVYNLYASFEPEEFEGAKRFYPRWTGRRDKKGLPLYVYRLASLVPIEKELNAVSAERRYQRMCVMGRHPCLDCLNTMHSLVLLSMSL